MAKTAYQVLEDYVEIVTKAITDSLDKHGKEATGRLKQSVRVYPTIYGQKISLVVEMEEYWKYVEEGRKKGSKQPPPETMLKHLANRGYWYATGLKNLQNFRKDKKGNMVKRKKPMAKDKALKSLAYLIGRGIKKHGIKPTHFLEEAVDGFEQQLKRDLVAAIGRDIEVQIETELGLV